MKLRTVGNSMGGGGGVEGGRIVIGGMGREEEGRNR